MEIHSLWRNFLSGPACYPGMISRAFSYVAAVSGRATAGENDYWIYKETRTAADKSDVFRVIHHLPNDTRLRALLCRW